MFFLGNGLQRPESPKISLGNKIAKKHPDEMSTNYPTPGLSRDASSAELKYRNDLDATSQPIPSM